MCIPLVEDVVYLEIIEYTQEKECLECSENARLRPQTMYVSNSSEEMTELK